jgi:glycosyltransferase involved in cell wall biosynthesis
VRIAILAPPWVPVPPHGYGGTETVLDGLARGLTAAGHDVFLYATGDSTCPVERGFVLETAAGVGVPGAATELRHVINGYEAIVEWGPDIVHDHTLVGPLYAARFPGLPVATTNHGPFESELADFYRAVSTRVPVVAISHHQASLARETRIAAVIHHGIDLDRFAYRAGAPGDYALFLGRMCADKGVRTAALVARAAGVPLKIAAKLREPFEIEYFESQVQPLLGDGVDYVGEVDGRDKLDLLAGACCLLNPIQWPEPFGMVMIEALACGTPVVATPCGAVPELIDDGATGFIRPTHSGLVQALEAVDTLNRAACRGAAVERFSIERMVADHVALFERIVERRGDLVPLA